MIEIMNAINRTNTNKVWAKISGVSGLLNETAPVLINGDLYCVGGYITGQWQNTIRKYNPSTNTMDVIYSNFVGSTPMAWFWDTNKIAFVSNQSPTTLQILDVSTLTRTVGGTLSAGFLNRRLVTQQIGGPGIVNRFTWAIGVDNQHYVAHYPLKDTAISFPPLSGVSGCMVVGHPVTNKIFIFGGYLGSGQTANSYVQSGGYPGLITQISAMPAGRYSGVAVLVSDDIIHVIGGYIRFNSSNVATDTIFEYTISTDKWRVLDEKFEKSFAAQGHVQDGTKAVIAFNNTASTVGDIYTLDLG